jgi:hypothetical protein
MTDRDTAIDAVVTWVDGADPVHAARRVRFRDPKAHTSSAGAARFTDSGEIRYAVASLLTFCPFLRRIHIVTDRQRPTVLDLLPDPAGKIRIVDHTEIYDEHTDLLPVFSSRSIETMIHRIPELANRFLYLNDDIFVGRPMEIIDYFDGDLPVLQGQIKPLPGSVVRFVKRIFGRGRPGYGAAQRAAAQLAGWTDKYLLAEHQPHPMRRETLAAFYADNPDALRAQAGHRFRSSDQVSPIGLTHHLELAGGARVIPAHDVGYIRPGRPTGPALMATLEALEAEAFASFCVQSFEAMQDTDRAAIRATLDRYYC